MIAMMMVSERAEHHEKRQRLSEERKGEMIGVGLIRQAR